MATTPTPDETAHAILRALTQRLSLRGGQSAPLGAVSLNARSEGVDPQDFEAGMQHGIARGWIKYDPDHHSVGLTDAGYAEA